MNGAGPICVMLGGPSAEREVSLRSGAAVAKALRGLGWPVDEVDPVGAWAVRPGTEAVFIALHGTYGEDGTVQSELDAKGIPYTGCDAASSRVAFDKVLTKRRLLEEGVPTSPFATVRAPAIPLPESLRLPVVLKPVRQGSSVGLHFVDRAEQWSGALEECLRHDTEALVEERVIGREVTVGILENRALPVVEVRPRSGSYDYRSKYTAGQTEYFCPAPFDETTLRRLERTGLEAFRAIGGRDYGRVDIMVREDGSPCVLEVNTLPGMTETSLLPKAAAAAGIGFAELCGQMLKLALGRGKERR